MVPKDPLNEGDGTVAELFYAFGVALHVELGNDDVFEFGEDVFEVAGLRVDGGTMVAQTSSSRVSLWAFTYACIVMFKLYKSGIQERPNYPRTFPRCQDSY